MVMVVITKKISMHALNMLDVDELGLDKMDRSIMLP
jgi:Holliday junction resolvasome RuvABC ATP-dependent DNA helicase subunit